MLDMNELLEREILVKIDDIYCLKIGWCVVRIPAKENIQEYIKNFKEYYKEILPFFDRYKKPTTKPKLIRETQEKIKYLENVGLI
ncbi:MAG: hypothetical protein ACRCTZ_11375 [Sarcina sp.]